MSYFKKMHYPNLNRNPSWQFALASVKKARTTEVIAVELWSEDLSDKIGYFIKNSDIVSHLFKSSLNLISSQTGMWALRP